MHPTVMRMRHRVLQVIDPERLTWEERFRPQWACTGQGAFEAGRRTYWFGDCRFTAWKASDGITIGSYCSIASGVTLIAGGNHLVDAVSTYPFTMLERWRDWNAEPQPPQHLLIGNDVWIGANAMVLGDVTIGDGAVIGAGAVVVRDVPPYTIVTGVPARRVRERFTPEEVATLLGLKWWEWPEESILEAEPLLRGEDVGGLAAFWASRRDVSGEPRRSREPAGRGA